MKRILILAACAVLMLNVNAVKAAPVHSSPIGVTVTDGDPFDQIMDVLKELKNIKEELIKIKADENNSNRFMNQAALDAAGKVFEQMMKLGELQEKYGSVPFTDSERTKLTDFFVQNYVLLSDSPLTDEAAQGVRDKLKEYNTIGELITGLATDL